MSLASARRHKANLALVALLFVVTRTAAALLGLRYLADETTWFVQLLDLHILHDHLLRGLWHLHAQPPLFNLLIGTAEKAGDHSFGALMLALQLALGLLAVLACYLTLADLGVNSCVCLAACLLLTLNPAAILYEFDPLYTELVYAIHCFIALALTRFIRSRAKAWLFTLAGLLVTLTLLRSSYQWLWAVLVIGLLLWQMPRDRRILGQTGVAVLVLSCLWPAKNFVLFHHFSSSTWANYSLAKHWGTSMDRPVIRAWLGEGRLRTLALPGQTEADRLSRLQTDWPTAKTGFPELDEITKQDGEATNWNSLPLLKMHDASGADVAFLLRHDGKTYLINVGHAVRDFFQPSPNYLIRFARDPRWQQSVAQYQHMEPVDRLVRRFCCNVFGFVDLPPDGIYRVERTSARVLLDNVETLCLGKVLAYMLLLACVGSFRSTSLWGNSREAKLVAMVLCTTIFYAFTVVALMEVGENMRYSFETQSLVVIVVTLFLSELWRFRKSSERTSL